MTTKLAKHNLLKYLHPSVLFVLALNVSKDEVVSGMTPKAHPVNI